jgi:hypothetical protein
MIQLLQKKYQLVLWPTQHRSSEAIALRIDFDDLAEARAKLDAGRRSGEYSSGLLMEWHKQSGVWDLIEQFP